MIIDLIFFLKTLLVLWFFSLTQSLLMLTFQSLVCSIFSFGGFNLQDGVYVIFKYFVVHQSGGGDLSFGDEDGFFGSFDGGGIANLKDSNLAMTIRRASFGAKAIREHDCIQLQVAIRLVGIVIGFEDIVEETLFFHATFSIILLKNNSNIKQKFFS